MRASSVKNPMVLLFFILAGIVLGGFIGTLTEQISFLDWLNYGQSFGTDAPLVLNLGVIVLTIGLSIKITIAGIFGMILAAVLYHFI